MTRSTADPVQSNPGFALLLKNVSLRDLRCSPATERRVEELSQEIRRKLSITVPEKDRRLASLMLAKHQQEEFTLHKSHLEEQRRREEARRASLEQRRRKRLLRRISPWQEDLEARGRRREEQEMMLAEEHPTQARSEEAKERQERLLKERQRGEEAHRERELHVAREKERQAARRKEMRAKRARRRLQMENQRELLKHVSLKKDVEKQERTEKEQKREELERRLRRSEENHALLVEARMQEMRGRVAREDELMRRARQSAGREDGLRMERRRMLTERCHLRTHRAVVQAQENLHKRAQSARQENQGKEITHRRLRQKVLEEEKAQWEQRCRAVADKEERRERLQKEREEAQERRRRVALASSYMRERVREQTSRRTFNQMARDAELSSHLERLKLSKQ